MGRHTDTRTHKQDDRHTDKTHPRAGRVSAWPATDRPTSTDIDRDERGSRQARLSPAVGVRPRAALRCLRPPHWGAFAARPLRRPGPRLAPSRPPQPTLSTPPPAYPPHHRLHRSGRRLHRRQGVNSASSHASCCEQLFAASLGAPGGAAPGWILWTADLPGALVSAATLVAFGRIRDSHRAMQAVPVRIIAGRRASLPHLAAASVQAMLSVMIAATCLALVATGAWQLGLLGGGSWQLLLGTGVFLCSGRRGAPCAVTRDWSTRGGRLS